MCERLDAKVRIKTEQLKARDQKIQAPQKRLTLFHKKWRWWTVFQMWVTKELADYQKLKSEYRSMVDDLCNDTLKLDPPLAPYKILIWSGKGPSTLGC